MLALSLSPIHLHWHLSPDDPSARSCCLHGHDRSCMALMDRGRGMAAIPELPTNLVDVALSFDALSIAEDLEVYNNFYP